MRRPGVAEFDTWAVELGDKSSAVAGLVVASVAIAVRWQAADDHPP